jgi:hypothetical protein
MNSWTDFAGEEFGTHHVGDQQRHRREIADRIIAQRRIEEPDGGPTAVKMV